MYFDPAQSDLILYPAAINDASRCFTCSSPINAKIIHHQRELDRPPFVLPKAGDTGALFVSERSELLLKELVSKNA